MKWSKAGKEEERDTAQEARNPENTGQKWRRGSQIWDKEAERQGQADRNGAKSQEDR